MSGSTVGGVIGGGIGFLVGGPAGARWGFMIGSTLGGIVAPGSVRGPSLSDASRQTSQEGVPIPFGYGTFSVAGHLLYCSEAEEHIRKEGGKGGGPVVETPYYTRNFAIAVCAGEATVVQVKQNGKLVYDITPTSTIRGKNAKFLRKATIYPGSETQPVDPTLEAIFGVGNIQPFLGLCYLMFEDFECVNAAAVDQFEFVVQKCGDVIDLADTRIRFLAVPATTDQVYTTTRDATHTTRTGGLSGGTEFAFVAANFGLACAIEGTGQFWRSTDNGVTWSEAATAPVANRSYRGIAIGNGVCIAVARGTGADSGKVFVSVSTDDGATWAESADLTAINDPNDIAFGAQTFVIAADNGLFTSPSGGIWSQAQVATNMIAAYFNGTNWLAGGNNASAYSAGPSAQTWTAHTTGLPSAIRTLCGQEDYFLAHCAEPEGIYRTDDLGENWAAVGASASPPACSASGEGIDYVIDSNNAWWSTDGGLTFTAENFAVTDINDIAYVAPNAQWYVVPDAPGLYADPDGVLLTEYADGEEASDCGTTDGEIVADLCERVGIDASEYDVSELTHEIRGYRCATGASAYGFIEPLMHAFFFDRAEWDKKLRFVNRGGAPVAALTMDDLVARDGPAIVEELAEETPLLRKVNVLTIDPAANFSMSKQTWQRRASTVVSVGEASFEIPITCDADTAAQIAEKKGKIAWSETEKRHFGLTVKHSYLTPTDIVALTDHDGKTHRVRIPLTREERGVISVEDAVKDRASTYVSTVAGVENPNKPEVPEGVIGPTLLALMNLPQLRTQDSTPGIYVGMAGILSGWTGAQLLMSVDGGVSYQTALTVTVPTIMGTLTEDEDSNGEPIRVHVFGGELSSKTTAQVDAGENYSGVITAGVTEVLAYEDATETAPSYYDLETITRGLEGSAIAGHSAGDQFVDLSTAYFVPISQAYAGQTLYFKAVGLGLSPDAIDAVSFVYEGWEYVYDGGEIT